MSLPLPSRFLALPRLFAAPRRARLFALGGVASLLLPPLATRAHDPAADPPLRVLIVGGGPDLANNQVAIESNVRYVGKLLPPNTPRATLFADGDANHATVLFDDDGRNQSTGEQILNLINPGADGLSRHYRKPNIGAKLDGASRADDINRIFGQLTQDESADPGGHRLLLYFTGHGSPSPRDIENNVYDLWNEPRDPAKRELAGLTVRELARQIGRLPNDVPVTVVMVQCFSGAFGNLIFENGDPKGAMTKRDICGFFATVKERVAAGCTSAVNEAEYRDFTSFFFAALTGRDRVGRRVTGADYNGDGRIGMDEAYCYSLIHDDSIDVPICTSDVFLRQFVPAEDQEIFQSTSYANARVWATIPQRAALDALSDKLKLNGSNRLLTAFTMWRNMGGGNGKRQGNGDFQNAQARFKAIQSDSRSSLLREFPGLKLSDGNARREARQTAIAQLNREAEQGKWKDLLDADTAIEKAGRALEAQAVSESQVYRFVRLVKSIVLAHRLKEGADAGRKELYAHLVAAESRTLLPPAETVNREAALLK